MWDHRHTEAQRSCLRRYIVERRVRCQPSYVSERISSDTHSLDTQRGVVCYMGFFGAPSLAHQLLLRSISPLHVEGLVEFL